MALLDILEFDPLANFRSRCPNCQTHTIEIITPEDEIICADCATVKDRILTLDYPKETVDSDGEVNQYYADLPGDNAVFLPTRTRKTKHCDKWSNYNRVFHLNEIMAAMATENPVLPESLLRLILDSVNTGAFGNPEDFSYAHIRKILRTVDIPPALRAKYRSEPRPQNYWNERPLQDLRRYTERWRWILREIYKYFGLKDKTPDFPATLQCWIRQTFEQRLIPAFNQIDKKTRRHFPNYTYVIMKLLQHLDFQQGLKSTHPLSWVLRYRYWNPIPSRAKCKELDETIWAPMCERMNMKFIKSAVIWRYTKFSDGTRLITNHLR
jgi:transcription initiation factor TFIIIB Brf1 subunit/transcription initiation factor TFIIB